MKRILFISQYLNRFGTEAFMMSVFRGVDKSRFAVDFLLFSKQETDYSREVEAAGGRVFRVTSRRESMLGWHKQLKAFFKQHAHEYHAIHFCSNSLTSMAPIYYAHKYGIPVLVVHAHSSSARGLHNRVLHRLKRNYVRSITTHHFACSTEAGKWFFGNSPSVVIKNGVETPRYRYDEQMRAKVRMALNIPDDATVLGHVGRFSVEKNQTFILDIFATYINTHAGAKLMLVGNGPMLEEMKQKAQSLGIQDDVLFLGERSDVNELMQAMDLFVMPSTFEGLPFVLVEAQCAALPCVISDVISRDICITPNVTYQSLEQSAEVWAKTIEDVLGAYARQDTSAIIAKAGYSIADTIRYLEGVYEGE